MVAEELADILGGRLIGERRAPVRGFEFNSKRVEEGFVFIPLKGRRDGHEFIGDAVKRGASGYLTERGNVAPSRFFIEVESSTDALRRIAEFKRRSFRGIVVGITGSVGKTTTKELFNFTLSKLFRTHRNRESFNNFIGVPYTLSNIPDGAEVLIQEIGANRAGEVEELSRLLKPDIGVITSVGEAHIEGFGNLESVIAEKRAILNHSSIGIVPSDFPYRGDAIRFGRGGDVELVKAEMDEGGANFTLRSISGTVSARVNVPGKGILKSILATCALLEALRIDISVLEGVSDFRMPKWRMNVRRTGSTTLIMDFYNANPLSMRNAIDVLSLHSGRKVAILGEMLELGEVSVEKHREIGSLLSQNGVDVLISLGKDAVHYGELFSGEHHHFEDLNELKAFLKSFNLKNSAVLIKGSRANRLEEVLEEIDESCGY